MISLSTKVTSASIYRSGAEVVRRGTARLEEGVQELRVFGLTGSVSQDTVRLFSSEGVRCSNQRFEYLEDKDKVETRKLNDQIEALEQQIEIKNTQARLWQSNGDFTARTAQDLDGISLYIEKLPERLSAINSEVKELQKQLEELRDKLDETEEQESRPVFVADITASAAGEYPFEMRYFDNQAWWNPVYEMYTDAKQPLEIRMRANVRQQTQEDWEDVSVSLFTGNPSSGGSLPEVGPVYLRIREEVQRSFKSLAPQGPYGMGMMAAMAAPMDADADASATNEVEEIADIRMTTDEASVNEDVTMTEYALPGSKKIRSGPEGIMVDLNSYSVPAEYQRAAAPVLDPTVYLVAKVRNTDIPFNNKVSVGVYLNDKFTGNVWISPDLNKEEINITLGEEEKIHVSRKELSRKNSFVLLKGQKTTDYVYETVVTNLSAEAVEVLITDQVPVSQAKEIVVETKDISGAALDSEKGILTKTLSVPAGESASFRVAYHVAWPKDKRIQETRTQGGRRFCPTCGAEVFGKFCPECGSVVN